MKKQTDKTLQRVEEDIAKYKQEIEERRIKIVTLEALLPKEAKEVARPDGFNIAGALREGLNAKNGEWVSIDTLIEIIKTKWNYVPNRKSAQIQLNAWAKVGKIEKDSSRSGYYKNKLA